MLRARAAAAAVCVACGCNAANWAQVSGENMQNTVDSRPSPWSRRWGHASVVLRGAGTSSDKLVILGGDSFHSPTSTNDDSIAEAEANTSPVDVYWPPAGGGQLRNDVWATTGAAWQTYDDHLHRNVYGDPISSVASTTSWEEMGQAVVPPYGVPYYEWLCCVSNASLPCTSTVCNATAAGGVNTTALFLSSAGRTGYTGFAGLAAGRNITNAGMLPGPRRWSPRRSHGAVVVPHPSGVSAIVVMGGRARSANGYDPSPGAPTAGAQDKGHEDAVLMNDVWMSLDGGATWSISNGGCTVPHTLHSTQPPLARQACVSNADCAAVGAAACVSFACVCAHWTPRERFATAALGNSIFVAAGVTWQPQGRCGAWMCASQGAVVALNDVWRSADLGRTWTLITTSTPWAPRADATMVANNGALLLLAGRAYIAANTSASTSSGSALLADMWTSTATNGSISTVGREWRPLIVSTSWAARAGAAAVMADTVLAVIAGQIIVPTPPPTPTPAPATQIDMAVAAINAPMKRPTPTPSPSTLRGNDMLRMRVAPSSEVWTLQLNTSLSGVNGSATSIVAQSLPAAYLWNASAYITPLLPFIDFSLNRSTRIFGYMHSRMPLKQLPMIPAATLSLLASRGVTTLAALKSAPASLIRNLKRDGVHDVCAYKKWATEVVTRCTTRLRGHEGDLSKIVFRNVDTKVRTPPPVDDGCLGDTSVVIGGALLEAGHAPCRQLWPPRAYLTAQLLNGALYVVGGMSELNYAYNDLWYRDEVAPITRIARAPRDGSSDTRFLFEASEAGCKFEYRAVDVGTGYELRSWSPVAANYDASRINDDRRRTRLEVRAVDPAGNRDNAVELGRNAWEWTYVPPFPWLLLTLVLLFSFLLIIIALFLYRRYRLRKLYEEYLQRRRLLKLGARMKRRFVEYDGTLQAGVDVNERSHEPDDVSAIRAPGVEGPRFTLDMAPEPAVDELDVPPDAAPAAPPAEPTPSRSKSRRSAKVAPSPQTALQPGLPAPVSISTGQPLSPLEAVNALQQSRAGRSILQSSAALRDNMPSPSYARRGARVAPFPDVTATPRAGVQDAPVATPSAVLLADNRLVDPESLRMQAQSLSRRPRVTAISALRQALQRASATVSPAVGSPTPPSHRTRTAGRASARVAPAEADADVAHEDAAAPTRRSFAPWIPSGTVTHNGDDLGGEGRRGGSTARVAPSPGGRPGARVVSVQPRLGRQAPSPEREAAARGRSASPRAPLLRDAGPASARPGFSPDGRSRRGSGASGGSAPRVAVPWR